MCIGTEVLQNNILLNDYKNIFSDEQKQKDAAAAAHFYIKAAKISPGHYHFKEVCAGGLNFCYFFPIRQTQHFYLLDNWFSGHRLAPPPPHTPLVPTHHFYILCKICEHIYRQKLFLAQGGNDMP